jgi:hypothetical protein
MRSATIARLPHVQLALLRGVHHDRDGCRQRIALERLRGADFESSTTRAFLRAIDGPDL